jgi:D-alanyl-D-alanine carboxypeptidase (penicillin-binding protein 5/6)
MKKYRFLSLLLAGLMALALTCPAMALEDPKPHAGAAIVVYGDTGEVLYDFNAHQRMYPASVTKIMTSLVVLDAVAAGELSLDTPVTASAQAVDLPLGSSTAEIRAGEVLTIEQLLYCDLLPSGNDACNILAEAVEGTAEGFAARMNAKAEQLGMNDTHFTNPHGLHDPDHYTSAYDIYLMASAAMENETFRTIVGSPSYNIAATNLQPERTIYTTNGLIGSYIVPGCLYSKAIGIKTGYTGEAGRCLASAAVDEEGRTFYCVVLNSEITNEEDGRHYWQFEESKRLLEWAFANFHRVTLLDQDTEDVLREVKVSLSDEADYVLAQPVGEIAATMPSDYDPKLAKLDFDLPTEPVEAPIQAGQKLGTVTLSYDGTEYGTLEMVAADSVERSDFLYALQQIERYWSKWWVKAAVIGGVVVILLLILYLTVVRPKQRRAKRYSYSGGGRRGGSNYRGRR